MGKTSLGTLWQNGLHAVAHAMSPMRSRDRIALLLRLENIDLLSDYLGKTGLAHLFAQLSMRMVETIRPGDFVQCASPGVFTILLRTRSEVEAMRIAQRLQTSCQTELQVCGLAITPIISGVLVQNLGNRPVPVRQLMSCGTAKLRQLGAEDLGRIQLIAYQEDRASEDIPATVSEAAALNQIRAYFQPQVCCDTGRIVGFEALARWKHPTRGLLSPMDFMPGLRNIDHTALTRTMLHQSLKALKRWDAMGWDIESVSLNVPQNELSSPEFVDTLIWELDQHSLDPSRLVIELLESIGPVNSGHQIRNNLKRLSQAGCMLDMDDFGTGYATLDSLRQFSVNRIKIDRCFVTDCNHHPGQQKMILGILAMAERLGLSTLAEGVETPEEHSYLAQIGCGFVQGYAVARPMPLNEVDDFMVNFRRRQAELPDMPHKKAG